MFGKRAFVSLHPVQIALIAFIIGAVLMYVIGTGIINIPFLSFCGAAK